ncbi:MULTISPECIES: ArsR/SmtB family transcription factor [Subtercola]|uniref:Transcriptional regulator n=1 Tax=Subtercola vilae TaxID=2056433 RepID=A0A4T2C719_9MICO|nr:MULTISPECIES: metalloregulator ArsR/SmtB family transcription factor [Subtercola]MEA9984741.1 metalloregulator ArsR/SmtB family transcription factor [Subtercola sp. RTI3]TIH39091.1 transcriptional regulator [Subtercola vilae]
MADIFSVIADPTRRHVLSLLLERYVGADTSVAADIPAVAGTEGDERPLGEISVSELVTLTELSQPTVSKHLKVLRDAGLVSVREVGQHRYYALDASPLEELEDWVIPFLSADFDEALDDDGIGFSDDLAVLTEQATSSAARVGKSVGQTVATATERARTIFGEATRRFPTISRSSD